MADIAFSITPTFAQIGAGKFALPDAGIDQSKIDLVRLMGLLWDVKVAFAGGAIKADADSVVLTVTIDGSTT